MKRKEITNDLIARFNQVRELNKDKKFDYKEMSAMLCGMGFPSVGGGGCILRAMCDGINPPVINVSKGVYIFPKEPVYKERIKTAMAKYYELSRPKKQAKVVNENNVLNLNTADSTADLIKQAIAILKQHKYKIYKPSITYEEV